MTLTILFRTDIVREATFLTIREGTMPVFTIGTCPTHHLEGTTFTTLATPTHGDADVRVWQVQIEPGTPSVPHVLTKTEIFVVQQGEAVVSLGDDEHEARAGDVIVVPAETPFALSAFGDDPFRALVCFPLEGKAVLPGKEPFTPPWGA